MDRDIKSGFLMAPPSWLQQKLSKPWVQKQCVLYPSSRQGVKRLEVFDLTPSRLRKEPASLIIPLTDCVKIGEERHKSRDYVFTVVTRDESHMFAAINIIELRKWVDALQRIAFEATEHPHGELGLKTGGDSEQFCDNNALYGSVSEKLVFAVSVDDNEMAQRLGVTGPHLVEISGSAVLLRSSTDQRVLFTWQFNHIRRYGLSRGAFVLEVGRSSETGAGSFVFRSPQSSQLQAGLLRAMGALEARRRSGPPELPTSLPPAAPLETQTLGRKKPAVAKPPRRTKQGAAAPAAAAEPLNLPNVVPLAEKQQRLTESLQLDGHSYSNVGFEEEVYAEPMERTDAWRELGRDVEHVEHAPQRGSALIDLSALSLSPTVPTDKRGSTSYACLQHMALSSEGGAGESGGVYARLGPAGGRQAPLVDVSEAPAPPVDPRSLYYQHDLYENLANPPPPEELLYENFPQQRPDALPAAKDKEAKTPKGAKDHTKLKSSKVSEPLKGGEASKSAKKSKDKNISSDSKATSGAKMDHLQRLVSLDSGVTRVTVNDSQYAVPTKELMETQSENSRL